MKRDAEAEAEVVEEIHAARSVDDRSGARAPAEEAGQSGMVSFSPKMKIEPGADVRTTALISTPFQWNSSPARLDDDDQHRHREDEAERLEHQPEDRDRRRR